MANILLNKDEIDAIGKLYFSVSIGKESWSMQDEKTYQILAQLFEKLHFVTRYDYMTIRSFYYFGKDVDKMISYADDLDDEECGNLLYFIIKDRKQSDPTSGQFSKYFNTFLIYLIKKVFNKTDFPELEEELKKKYF